MKKFHAKYLAYAAIPVAAFALLLTNTALAHGWGWGGKVDPEQFAQQQQTMFQEQADLLGTNIDQVKNAWAQGKTMMELADELGLSETDLQNKMRTVHLADLKTRLQTLVTNGIITQIQADQRYSFMEQHMTSAAPGKTMGRMMF